MNPWEAAEPPRNNLSTGAPVPGAARLRLQWLLFAIALGYMFGQFLAWRAAPIFGILLQSMRPSNPLPILFGARVLITLVTIFLALLFGFGQGSTAVRRASLSAENLAQEQRRASASLVVMAVVLALFVSYQVFVFLLIRQLTRQ